ncbi:hypothetical protein DPMN_095537 [Dreissena polymorpha]|uniref:Uncharacterized protein n=1 Tax=Dreissena polymorpha TaxID=45954 RepID=A0A9D4L830_DREPO|nr:hypothetical protein DPMN_095537 [Dreissena polymorpha]
MCLTLCESTRSSVACEGKRAVSCWNRSSTCMGYQGVETLTSARAEKNAARAAFKCCSTSKMLLEQQIYCSTSIFSARAENSCSTSIYF